MIPVHRVKLWIDMLPNRSLNRGFAALLHVVKTAVAAGLAWFIAVRLFGHAHPYFAPLTVILVTQITVYQSLNKSLERVMGVIVGVLLSYGLSRVLGINAVSIALLTGVSLAVGRLARLGPGPAVQVPVSALLVLVIGTTSGGYAVDRVVDTALGALVAVSVNLLVVPPTHLDDASRALHHLLQDLGDLMAALGRGLGERRGIDVEAAHAWLTRARGMEAGSLGVARQAVALSREGVRWNPAGKGYRRELSWLGGVLDTSAILVIRLRVITRTLADAGDSLGSAFPPDTAESVGRVAEAAAQALEHFIYEIPKEAADRNFAWFQAALEALEGAYQEAWAASPQSDSQRLWLLADSLWVDLHRLIGEMSQFPVYVK